MPLDSPADGDGAVEVLRRSLVAGIVVRGSRLLLLDNVKHGLRREPVGGKIEPGETPEEAMAREIEEEIQCRLVRCTSLGIETTQSPEGDFTVHTFLCDIDGEPQIPERERHKLHALGWYTFAELETMAAEDPVSLVPNVRAMLGQLKALLAA